MRTNFTLEYWLDDGWYVGRLMEIPGVFSQAESLPELEENIRDAYHLMLTEKALPDVKVQTKTIEMIIAEVKPENRKMDDFFEAARKVEIDGEAVRKWREISKL